MSFPAHPDKLADPITRRGVTIPEPDGTLPETRHLPQQERSRATLELLEKSARQVLETEGRDRFTTAQVATAAGVSIGTLYRYFPDRTAILDRVWPDRESAYLPPAEL